jgi:hypothetical protein
LASKWVGQTAQGNTGFILVQGNLVGTNAAGTAAIPNSADGMALNGNGLGGTITVGGGAAGAGNVVSGNSGRGIDLTSFGTQQVSVVRGNLVGTDATGAQRLPNGTYGILVGANNAVIMAVLLVVIGVTLIGDAISGFST